MTSQRSLLAVNHTRLFSGAEQVLARMLEAATEEGYAVTCCAPEGPLTDRLCGAGVAIVPLPELKPTGPGRGRALGVLAAAEVRAARAIRIAAAEVDVIVVNGLMALPAVAMARTAASVCWMVHDVPVRRDLRAVVRLTARSIDAAMAPSEQAAAFPRDLGIPTTVSVNGTPLPPPRSSTRPEPPVVGCSAAITRWKGQHVLLDAAASIPDIEIELMGMPFPGDEPYEAELRRRADEPDLSGRVRFLGHVSNPLDRMRSWSVCVSPSVEPEAGSLSLLEAMSLGLTIVATRHGCAEEYLGPAGVLVPPRDDEALTTAIRDLLDDDDRARELGAAARARVESEFTIEQSRDRFLDVIATLAGSRVGP